MPSQLLLFLVSHKVLPNSNPCGTWECGFVVALAVLEGWLDLMVLKGFSKVSNSMFVVLMKSWALEQCTGQMGGEISVRL